MNQNAVAGGIEELPDSMPLLDHPEKLRRRWAEDGVLYLRNAVDPQAIAAVRREYLARLKEVGVVAEDAERPVFTGLTKLDGKLAHEVDDSVWQTLVAHPDFHSVIQRFMGDDPSWVPIVVHRSAAPTDMSKISDIFHGRHQDGVFNHGIPFITCWVPLMDIDQTIGGLAVVPGSHKQSYYDFDENSLGQPKGIPAGRLPDATWRRPNYKVGDILILHSMLAHAGLPNQSDLVRLSVDIRFLPGSEPKPIVGVVDRFAEPAVDVIADSGETLHFTIDERTMVRGPNGGRVTGSGLATVLFPGARIIAVTDDTGRARLARSVSRKYLDLPTGWFTELPKGWVAA